MTNLPVLRRDSSRRVLGGVCAGLARSWNVDPLLVRAALVVAAVVTSGLAVFAYLALWLAIPTDRSVIRPRRVWTPARTLVVLALLAAATAFVFPEGRQATIGFAILGVLAVAWFGLSSRRRRIPPPPAASAEPQWRQPPMPGRPASSFPPTYAPTPSSYAQPNPYGPQPTYASQAYPYPSRQHRPHAWRPIILGTLLAWVALWMAGAAGVDVRSVAYPAAALAAIGMGLVAASRPSRAVFARPRGLVGLGLVAALLTMAMMPSAATSASSSYRSITSASDLPPSLDLGVGAQTLDLSALTLDSDRTLTVTQDVGTLTLILPSDANVSASYAVDLGKLTTPEQTHPLQGPDLKAAESYPADTGKPTLTLVVEVSAGTLEVRR